jgi:general secretion pathway protein C
VLDTYFKHYFWSYHLLILGLAGLLVARTVNAFVAEALRSPASATTGGAAPLQGGQQDAKSAVPTNAFLSRNLFDAVREDIVAQQAQKDAAAKDKVVDFEADSPGCEKSGLKYTLVATVVSSDPLASIAVFVDPAKNEPVAYGLGEKIFDEAPLKAINWRRVTIEHANKCEYFSIEPDSDTQKPATPEVAAADTSGDGAPDLKIGQNVKKVSESEYEIPKNEIDNVVANLNVIATQARIVPSFDKGKANGFKLFSIRPDSLYSKIGIQNGDIVQKINGYEMNDPAKALEIYSKLKDAPQITVDLIRHGKTQTLSYNIK